MIVVSLFCGYSIVLTMFTLAVSFVHWQPNKLLPKVDHLHIANNSNRSENVPSMELNNEIEYSNHYILHSICETSWLASSSSGKGKTGSYRNIKKVTTPKLFVKNSHNSDIGFTVDCHSGE